MVAPVNDNFANAIDIVLSSEAYTSATIDNTDATIEAGEPLPNSDNRWTRSVWWRYTPPAEGSNLNLDTALGSGDTALSVYRGTSLGALTLLAWDDQSGGSSTSKLTGILCAPGETYYVQVTSWSGPASVVLNVVRNGVNNDNFANAEVVTVPTDGATFTSKSLPNRWATTETGEPSAVAHSSLRSMWWKYTPVTSGTATIDTQLSNAGGTADTQMSIYTGTAVGSLTTVASNADGGTTGGAQYSSKITLAVTAGVTYRIQVGAYGNAAINYVLRTVGPKTAASAVSVSGSAANVAVVGQPGATVSPIVVAGAFANVAATAHAGTVSLGAAPVMVPGAAANVSLGAQPGVVALGGGPVSVLGSAAAVVVAGQAGSALLGGDGSVVESSDEFVNDGYNYTGTARVFYEPPIVEPSPSVVRTKVKRVHQSIPAPTLVDGRPTW